MSNNIAVIPQINMSPALLAQFQAMTGADDLDQGVSGGFPVMSIRGAKWRMVEGGEESPIYMPGTKDLAPFIKVVLLKANANLSKTFYAGAFVEGSDAKPDCASNDGIVPSADSPNQQAPTCATCPNNVWGSKISASGSKIKACADVRRMAILPSDDMGYSPILLRIPGASLADLAAYGKALKKRGIPYNAVVTKLSFDAEAAYPKVVFQFERVLTPEEMGLVVERIGEPIVDDILGLSEVSAAAVSQAAPAADDKFGIPADAAPPATAAAVTKDDDLEQAVQAVENKAVIPAKPRARAKPGAGFGGTPAADAAPAEAKPEPAAAAPAALGGGDMLSDIDDALANLNF